MNFTEIEGQIRALEAAGYHEVVLSGINLGDYEAPTGENFYHVLRRIEELQPNFRVRISSIEPNLLKPEILEFVAQSKVIVQHFHIPLQSGSPEILRLMRRRYNAAYYEDLIARIKEQIPDCCIGVDVITGFPGETDRHFEETFAFLHRLPVSYLHVFSYSERDNTPAASFQGKIPARIKQERTNRLRALSAKKRFEFYASQLGTQRTVIPESFDSQSGHWTGWTENYVKIAFAGNQLLHNSPVRVMLRSVEGEYVAADVLAIADVEAMPTYIPLLLNLQ